MNTAAKKQNTPHLVDAGLSLKLAEWTGLEPATPGVTGRYSNRLNYHSALTCFSLPDNASRLPMLASPRGFEPRLSP